MIVASSGISWDHGALSRGLSRAGKIVALLSLACAVIGTSAAISFTTLGFSLGALLIVASYVVWLTRASTAGTLELRDGVLVVAQGRKTKTLAVADVASAWVGTKMLAGAPWSVVELRTRRGTTMSAHVRDGAAARTFVEALGFGPNGKAVSIDLGRGSRRLLHPLVGMLAYMIGAIGGTIAALPIIEGFLGLEWLAGISVFLGTGLGTVGVYLLLKRLFAAPVVTIGHDGVIVAKHLKKRRVARADLAKVHVPGPGLPLVVERRDGGAVGASAVLLDDARVDAVVQLAEARFADVPPPERAVAFERAGQDLAAWKARLRAALDPGYRATGATVEDATAVLVSNAATLEQRLGAALALRVAGQPPERVRVVAEGAADPRVRVALEAIADDEDDAALEKALARLELR